MSIPDGLWRSRVLMCLEVPELGILGCTGGRLSNLAFAELIDGALGDDDLGDATEAWVLRKVYKAAVALGIEQPQLELLKAKLGNDAGIALRDAIGSRLSSRCCQAHPQLSFQTICSWLHAGADLSAHYSQYNFSYEDRRITIDQTYAAYVWEALACLSDVLSHVCGIIFTPNTSPSTSFTVSDIPSSATDPLEAIKCASSCGTRIFKR